MTKHQRRWYHHFMLSIYAQMAIFVGAMIIFMVQGVVYAQIEDDLVVFSDECEVTIGPVNEDDKVTRRGAIMQCGEDQRHLGAMEAPYLYEVLTNQREPVIVCVKTVSEFHKKARWYCEMDPEGEEQT